MGNQAAETAGGPMVVVAVEQIEREEKRLVTDNLAREFLPGFLKGMVSLCRWPAARRWVVNYYEKRAPGIWAEVLCRKRYIDDRLAEAAGQGIRQLVILGAGLDTRAYRPELTRGMRVIEADLPENSAYKKARLEKLLGGVPANLALVPLDFEKDDIGRALEAGGYRAGEKTFFILEAVTQYLHGAAVEKVFGFLSGAAPGSRFVFTFILKDFLEGRDLHGQELLYKVYRLERRLWHFGLEPREASALLERFGWREIDQAGKLEFAERYLKPLGRSVRVMEIERVSFASKE